METFFWSLLTAAISALSYVAYRHPTPFRNNIAYPLLILSVLGVIFISAANMGGAGVQINELTKEVTNLETENKMLTYHAQKLKKAYDSEVKALIIGGAISVYLLLLINLPKLLSLKDDKEIIS